MGEIVNLHRVKQQRKHAIDAAEAKENRVRHGRTKAAKANDKRAEARRTALIDGQHRDTPG